MVLNVKHEIKRFLKNPFFGGGSTQAINYFFFSRLVYFLGLEVAKILGLSEAKDTRVMAEKKIKLGLNHENLIKIYENCILLGRRV